jgi:putative peptidoglycan lipid II flippase
MNFKQKISGFIKNKLSLFFLSSSLILALSSLLSRFLGVYRDHLLAKTFGAGQTLDAYYAAFRVPDFLYALFIMSSVSVVCIPIFHKFQAEKKIKEAFIFMNKTLNTFFVLYLLFLSLIWFFLDDLIVFYVPGFDLYKQNLTVELMKVLLFSPVFFLISSVMIAVENAFLKFFAQSLAPIFYNLGILLGIYFLVPNYNVYGLVYGVIIGAFLQMLVLLPSFLKTGYTFYFKFFTFTEIIEMFKKILPRLLTVLGLQFALLVDVFLGSRLEEGSVSLLNFANNLYSLPYGVIAVSISIPAFSLLSQAYAKKDFSKFIQTLKKYLEKTMFWLFPAILGFYFILPDLVNFLFFYGNFTISDKTLLISLVQIFLLGLFFQGLIPLFSRAFFAQEKTWLVFFINLFALIINIILSFILSKHYGVLGLAWGTSISFFLILLMFLFLIYQSFTKIIDYFKLFKFFLSALMMFLFLNLLNYYFIIDILVLRLIFNILLGGIFYLLLQKKYFLKILNEN